MNPWGLSAGSVCALLMGVAGFVALGQMGGSWALPMLASVSLLLLRRRQGLSQGLWMWQVMAALVALGSALGPLLFGIPWSLSGAVLLIFLALHRARTGEGPRDDRLLLILGVLMVLLASTRERGLWMGLTHLVLIGTVPLGLMYTELEERYGPRVRNPFGFGALTRLVLVTGFLSVGLFIFIPRLNAQALVEYGERLNRVGFESGEVDLGGLGDLMDNPDLVFRAKIEDEQGQVQQGPFYFRGLALDEFDGRRWRSTLENNRSARRRAPDEAPARAGPGQLRQALQLEPLESPPLFVVPQAETLFLEERVAMDAAGALRVEGPPRRRELVVLSRDIGGAGMAGLRRRPGYGQGLPPDLDPRIQALAREWVGEARTPQAKVQALLRGLGQGYTYSAVPRAGLASQPLSEFLFVTREGHCEYFATALAVLLRAVDVPAVVVVGFYGGEWNAVGEYVAVRQRDAHAWVEARLSPDIWTRLDATPVGDEALGSPGRFGQLGDWLVSRWHSAVLGYDLDDQLAAGRAIASALSPGSETSGLAAAPALGGVVLVYGLGIGALLLALRGLGGSSTQSRTPLSREEKLHRQARALVAKRGWEIPESLPAVSAAMWLREQVGEAAKPLEELAWLASAARYGPGSQPEQVSRAKRAYQALKSLPDAKQVDAGPGRR